MTKSTGMKHFKLALALGGLLLAGCTHYESKTETTETVVKRGPAPAAVEPARPVRTIDSVILDVRDAPDAGAEAAALNRLHAWMADHRLTYQVGVTDAAGGAVSAPSTVSFPLIVTVSIYDQQQPVRDFKFTPKDNRDLTILGVQ